MIITLNRAFISYFILLIKLSMKKLVLSSLILLSGLVLCHPVAKAQNNNDANIWNISVRFCNWEELTPSLNLVADSWIEYDICIDFINPTNSDININYSFIDGTLTNDEYQNKACTIDQLTNFGQFVTSENTYVIVPAHDYIEQKASIKFPIWMSGLVNWCLVYSLVDDSEEDIEQEQWTSMFKIQLRKASFIDVIVGWDVKRELVSSWKISRSFDRKNSTLSISAPVFNKWNINEKAHIEWTVKNILWFNTDLTSPDKIVLANSEFFVTASAENIPWYRMFYHIEWNIISEWDINFDAELLWWDIASNSITVPFSITAFIFPRELFILILWIILLIRLIRYLSKHLTFHK